AGAQSITVLVPGADVVFARTAVRARNREQLERALPFALEEQLAEPVEGLHFAYEIEAGGAGQTVAAVRRERLRAWLEGLAARGAVGAHAINLRSGEFAAQHRGQPTRRLWQLASRLAIAAVVLWLVLAAGEYAALSYRLDRLQQQQVALYRQVYPQAKNVPNP